MVTRPQTRPPNRPLPTFPQAAQLALADTQLRRNLRKATTTIRAKRAAVVGELPDWEELRAAGAAIKTDVMRHLDRYLLQLEEAVIRAGGHVHWARDAAEANAVVVGLVRAAGAPRVVKVKSLTTDEIGLNEALRCAGVEAVETDLAELIIQLAGEKSSHILVPAIHKNRSEIRDLFRRTIARDQEVSDNPQELAAAARRYLRARFLAAEVAISGANFAVAETGTLAVVESEGNGRMCLTLPQTLITVMGIEKVIPTFRDLEVFLQLLPRSSTGERMNPYTSLWTGATPGDGPQAVHLVLLDNGRTQVLADPVGRQALHCIRCSACLNICPVYARTGGHAYGSVYPGPIGAILTPQLVGLERAKTLPYASTLCGACYAVCPVQINIPEVLLHLRGEVTRRAGPLNPEAVVMRQLARIFASPQRYERAQRLARRGQRIFIHDGVIDRLPGLLAGWSQARDLAPLPRQTFREWWRDRQRMAQAAPERARALGEAAKQGERGESGGAR
jgi:L-lactate dehydrogenase complex protein LldF